MLNIEAVNMNSYREICEAILKIACDKDMLENRISYKNVFGAVGGYFDETIFCSCGHFGFALKLPQNELDALFREGAKPLKYFAKGHVKKGYAVLTQQVINDRDKLKKLISVSIKNLDV